MNDGHLAKRGEAASLDTDGPAPSTAFSPASGQHRARLPHSRTHFAPARTEIFNAKAQRREDATRPPATEGTELRISLISRISKSTQSRPDAKRSIRPCVFASLRLCVKTSFPALAALGPSKMGCRRQDLPVKSNPVKPSQTKKGIISGGHRPPLQQSNPVKPGQSKKVISSDGHRPPLQQSNPVKPGQTKKVIISDGHRPPLQQSNPVKPGQTKKVISSDGHRPPLQQSNPVKPSQTKKVIISDGHRPPLQQSNPVKPGQSKKGGLTASFCRGGGKGALARARSKAACQPLARNATRLGARNASSGLALKLQLSAFGMQSGQQTKADQGQNQG